jgi:hypothetical protein
MNNSDEHLAAVQYLSTSSGDSQKGRFVIGGVCEIETCLTKNSAIDEFPSRDQSKGSLQSPNSKLLCHDKVQRTTCKTSPTAAAASIPRSNLQTRETHQQAQNTTCGVEMDTGAPSFKTGSAILSARSGSQDIPWLSTPIHNWAMNPDCTTNAEYRNFLIHVPRQFSRYAELLVYNQKVAIDRGLIYDVDKPTRTYIVGWLDWTTKMACVYVTLPRTMRGDIERTYDIPMCLVAHRNLLVAGLILMSIESCLRLPEKNSRYVDLYVLEDSCRTVLEE